MTLCMHPIRRHEMFRAYSACWLECDTLHTLRLPWYSKVVLDSQLAGRGFETMQNLSVSSHFQPWTLASKCKSCLQWLRSPKWWADSHSTGDENANDPGGSTWKVLLLWNRSVWETWCDRLFSYSFLLTLLRGLCSLLTQIINHTIKTNQITFLISRLINMKTFIDDFYVHW